MAVSSSVIPPFVEQGPASIFHANAAVTKIQDDIDAAPTLQASLGVIAQNVAAAAEPSILSADAHIVAFALSTALNPDTDNPLTYYTLPPPDFSTIGISDGSPTTEVPPFTDPFITGVPAPTGLPTTEVIIDSFITDVPVPTGTAVPTPSASAPPERCLFGQRCENELCCSEDYFCGSGEDFCGRGCRPELGICDTISSTTGVLPIVTESVATPTTEVPATTGTGTFTVIYSCRPTGPTTSSSSRSSSSTSVSSSSRSSSTSVSSSRSSTTRRSTSSGQTTRSRSSRSRSSTRSSSTRSSKTSKGPKPPATTTQPTLPTKYVTTYTTEYITVCPITKPCHGGIKTETYTITETCEGDEHDYTRPPIPPNFTTTITVCNLCQGRPTLTVTCPIETGPNKPDNTGKPDHPDNGNNPDHPDNGGKDHDGGDKNDHDKDGGDKHDGDKNDGHKGDGSKDDGSKHDGSKNDGSKDDGSKNDGHKGDDNNNDGHKNDDYKNDSHNPDQSGSNDDNNDKHSGNNDEDDDEYEQSNAAARAKMIIGEGLMATFILVVMGGLIALI